MQTAQTEYRLTCLTYSWPLSSVKANSIFELPLPSMLFFESKIEAAASLIRNADRSELKDALRKKIDNDVRRLKEFFRANIGATWAEATRPRATSAI